MEYFVFYLLQLVAILCFEQSSAQSLPVFITDPIHTYPNKDQRVSLTCQANVNPNAIAWYVNKKPIHNLDTIGVKIVSESSHLTINRLTRQEEGQYYCNATNIAGWTVSAKASVRIAYIDTVFQGPQSKTASIGETVVMECQPPDGLPIPKVFWKKDNITLVMNTRLKLLEKGDLRIDKAERSDTGSYVCGAYNIAASRESEPARLGVHQKPRFLITPHDQEVQVNGVAVFSCQVIGDPSTGITWTREKGEKIPERRSAILQDKSLRIDKVQMADEGNYVCKAGGPVSYVEAVAQLKVISQPSFIRTPDDQEVRAGTNVIFNCIAHGSPIPGIRWVHVDQHFVQDTSSGQFQVLSDGRLVISNVRKSNEGRYECRASSYIGSIRSSANLRVIDINDHPPPVIDIGPRNLTLVKGSTATFQCQARGTPVPQINWHKNGIRIDISNSDKRLVKLASGTLQINDIRYSDSANYTCEAKSGKRRTEWPASLKVTGTYNGVIMPTIDQRDLPPPPSVVSVVSTSDTWIIVKWEVESVWSADIDGYRVEYAEYDSEGGWIRAVEKTPQRQFKIVGLLPEKGYRILVRSVNTFGCGRPRLIEEVVYTAAETRINSLSPGELSDKMNALSIHDVQLKSITPSEVKVSWRVSGTTSELQLVTGFDLKYKSVPLSRCLATENADKRKHCSLSDKYVQQLKQEVNIPNTDPGSSAMTPDEGKEATKTIIMSISLENPTSYAVIEHLSPFTCYEVDVEPFVSPTPFGKVRGVNSKAKTVLTYDSTPSSSPTGITVKSVTNTTAEIRWIPPPYASRNGYLTGHSVHIIGNETKFSRSITVRPNTYTIQVHDLIPSMKYTIHVAARTCHGEGIRSLPANLIPAGMISQPYQLPEYVVISIFVIASIVLVIPIVFFFWWWCKVRNSPGKKMTKSKQSGTMVAGNGFNKENLSMQPILQPYGYDDYQQMPGVNCKQLPSGPHINGPIYSSTEGPSGVDHNHRYLAHRQPDLVEPFDSQQPQGANSSCWYDESNVSAPHTGSSSFSQNSQVNPVAPYACTSLLRQQLRLQAKEQEDGMQTKRGMHLRDVIPPPPQYPPPPVPGNPGDQMPFSASLEMLHHDSSDNMETGTRGHNMWAPPGAVPINGVHQSVHNSHKTGSNSHSDVSTGRKSSDHHPLLLDGSDGYNYHPGVQHQPDPGTYTTDETSDLEYAPQASYPPGYPPTHDQQPSYPPGYPPTHDQQPYYSLAHTNPTPQHPLLYTTQGRPPSPGYTTDESVYPQHRRPYPKSERRAQMKHTNNNTASMSGGSSGSPAGSGASSKKRNPITSQVLCDSDVNHV